MLKLIRSIVTAPFRILAAGAKLPASTPSSWDGEDQALATADHLSPDPFAAEEAPVLKEPFAAFRPVARRR